MFQRLKVFGVNVILIVLSVVIYAKSEYSASNLSPYHHSLYDLRTPSDKFFSFGQIYHGNVSLNNSNLYTFWYRRKFNESTAIRITAWSTRGASVDYPLFFIIRKQESVLSWQVPILLDYIYDYYVVSRTLCPGLSHPSIPQPIYIDVTSMSANQTSYAIVAEKINTFQLYMDKMMNVTVSPSQPVFYRFTFPPLVKSVTVRLTSSSSFCTVASIQDTRCPVFDLDRNVGFRGKRQTMTEQATFNVKETAFDKREFFLVIVVKAINKECSVVESILPRFKNVSIHITHSTPQSTYVKATLVAVAVYLGIYLLAFVFSISYQIRYKNWGVPPAELYVGDSSDSQSDGETKINFAVQGGITHDYGATSSGQGKEDDIAKPLNSMSSNDCANEHKDVDFLDDAFTDKAVIRTKPVLYVCDLAQKTRAQLKKRYSNYQWNLVTLAIFYGLPVIQLVITYQKILHVTGDEDSCFYNFACAQPLFVFSAFNSLFSNIGYVMLGILFLILVRRRDYLHRRAERCNDQLARLYGIPEHYGVFYALGWALMMEGLMSASYHICPNYSNFQFDTAFMYLMACLLMLKLYQNRHPDLVPRSHISFLMMALIIFIAVMGVIYGYLSFWIVFVILYILTVTFFSLKLYYMGEFELNIGLYSRVKNNLKSGLEPKPTYVKRFILLVLLNMVNWALALYGVIEQPSNFATFLLTILITNLMMYTTFYIIMKMIYKECIKPLALFYIVCSAILWGFSLYFFFRHVNSWQESPALSRQKNQPCVLLEFYDYHDVWHFLSAMSLFMSFMVLMTLDDDLWFVPRSRIPVF